MIRYLRCTVFGGLAVLALPAQAQCFNRAICDPGTIEVRTQISVVVPLADQASGSDMTKAMGDAERDLLVLSKGECDTLKGVFGGECAVASINVNSNVQDRGSRNKAAYVSISNTYQLTKTKH